jgi:L-alanine-DL-glutamate epimerase-like enolase superfamily enzyme
LSASARASRNTALMDLAAQLPAKVLHDLLGIPINTATAWAHQAGASRAGYAADVSRRRSISRGGVDPLGLETARQDDVSSRPS